MKSIKQHILEKLKVSKKYIGDFNLVDFVKCENLIEYEALLEKLRKEIKENATLAPLKQNIHNLYVLKSPDTDSMYIMINKRAFFIGTYDEMYYVYADKRTKRIIVNIEHEFGSTNTERNYGFKDFTMNDEEMQEWGGIYYLPEYLKESYNELIEYAENYI
jgi:hypothetical protein